MEICILEKVGNKLRIAIKGASLPLVNAVRRACYIDVPVMAVDIVEVFDNNTVLYDEIIAHRLGLIPLTSSEALKKYKGPEECANAQLGDPGCYVTLRLDVETGPREERIVYSGDLESSDPDVRPAYENIPIVVMAPDQRLRLQAYARLGYGREHAKWMPVSIAAHKYLPILSFDLGKADKECIECIEAAYPWIAEQMKKLGKGELKITEDINTSALYWCTTKRCGDAVQLRFDDSQFLLKIESTGALPPEEIVREAVRAIVRKAENLLSEIARLRREEG
ncbi:MAG TPA: DNA-directed RNA polymerase subunit D [Pyrodictium delaneyi]|uniref:DNA-directed RNA polymerase subunit Rpo3 n=1 Tax=Pyrodictium delaneyi TaxID=1273541 RepID=A0A832ZSV2_9CREN|nr:DNA-directed RNA polymerase subunit D [Pyrodictium delaneyi]